MRWMAIATSLLVLLHVGSCQKRLAPLATPYATVDNALPQISISTFDGKEHTLKTPRNKVTIVALWATWCAPCLEEFPVLHTWMDAHPDVQLLPLNVEGGQLDPAYVRHVAKDLKLDEPLYYTTPGKASPLGLRSLPVSYVVDAQGIVRAVHEGFSSADELIKWLDEHAK